MNILITGGAGFIGFHLTQLLAPTQYKLVIIDNLNDYYDTSLKYERLKRLGVNAQGIAYNQPIESSEFSNLTFMRAELSDHAAIIRIQEEYKFTHIIHLGAQAGVRFSLQAPFQYIDSNVKGFLSILEACRHHAPEMLIYASSSSVYGINQADNGFGTDQRTDNPVSLYAATKKANEVMAASYANLYKIPSVGIRFFTVYGPYGRPDMAYFKFTKAILDNKTIEIYNNGQMGRDFTYVSDAVEGIYNLLNNAEHIKQKSMAQIFNIGGNSPVSLMDFIGLIEKHTGKKAIKKFLPMQKGDVVNTWANIEESYKEFAYNPKVGLDQGIKKFVEWYRDFYNI